MLFNTLSEKKKDYEVSAVLFFFFLSSVCSFGTEMFLHIPSQFEVLCVGKMNTALVRGDFLAVKHLAAIRRELKETWQGSALECVQRMIVFYMSCKVLLLI